MFEGLEEKFELAPIEREDLSEYPVEIIDDGANSLDSDVLLARKAIADMMKLGAAAAKDLAVIASGTEHPRAYEVLGQLINSVSSNAKDLIDIQKKKSEIEIKSGKALPSNVTNNNVFVGTTKELMQLMKENRDGK